MVQEPPGLLSKILSFYPGAGALIGRPPSPARKGGCAIGPEGSEWPRPSLLGQSRSLPRNGMPQLHGTRRPLNGSEKSQFLEKMPEISRGRPEFIGGRSEAQSAAGRAMRLLVSNRLRPSLWGPWRGLPRPVALQLHGPRPPGPSSKILSFSLRSRGTNRRPPTGPVRQGGRAIGLRGSVWSRPRQLGRWRGLPSAGGPQLHGPRPAGSALRNSRIFQNISASAEIQRNASQISKGQHQSR
jgi:hypothetical protein